MNNSHNKQMYLQNVRAPLKLSLEKGKMLFRIELVNMSVTTF